jgi:hypothetical protein
LAPELVVVAAIRGFHRVRKLNMTAKQNEKPERTVEHSWLAHQGGWRAGANRHPFSKHFSIDAISWLLSEDLIEMASLQVERKSSTEAKPAPSKNS